MTGTPSAPQDPGPPTTSTDVAIIGAGPAGLFQAFQLGLLGLKAVVLDALPRAGGQCIELYPDKPIYDLPGIPVITGRALVERLLEQLAPFQTPLWLGHAVEHLQLRPEGGFELRAADGRVLHAGSVVIAAGVGAFTPRKPTVAGLDAFEGTQVLYRTDDPSRLAGRDVLVLGDEDPALEWALRLCAGHPDGHPHKARRVALLHRRDRWRAEAATVDTLHRLAERGALDLVFGQITGIETTADGTSLQGLTLLGADGQEHRRAVDLVLPQLGLSPHLGPIAHWGLALERKQLPVSPATFRTERPGLYAIGDINTYPGKRRLIVCGFHEATLAAYDMAQARQGDQPLHVQYTTTSAVLQQRLGVIPPQA